ncbi:dihydrolipoamide acetyltransferase family protein [Kitasatospora sp. NPDC097691]|uniref:dihydrolipoamide acetyltransferase family protein n=1 Tax=Kitasatospora sp. NPDC097691 TaxID=3157231 RepID=UPI003316916E
MTAAAEPRVFLLPDLGEGLTEAEVVGWRIAAGDTVEVDQVVVEVETVKAAVEVPVPYAGTVLELHAEVGAVVAVGAPLVSVGAAVPPSAEPPATWEAHGEETPAPSGNVLVGYGTRPAPTGRRRARRTTGRSGPPERSAAPLVISPLVRSLAREHGVDLTRLSPSGPHGVILRRDVERARDAERARDVEQTLRPAVDSAPQERIPLRGLRRATAEKLTRSSAIPTATTWVDVDATGLLQARDTLRAAAPDRPIGLLALLARICVAGLRRFPELNSTVDLPRGEIVRFPHVNLGFAAQTDRGLVVPVVRDAQLRTTAELAAELVRLTALARTGSLPPGELTGGTFTLNNYGVFGVDGSTPLVNHPEAAILGVGRVVDKPWVADGELTVRKVTQLSLTFDHRVCDGAVAGGFLRYVADCVERPTLLLAAL